LHYSYFCFKYSNVKDPKMNQNKIEIENLKCGGCVTTITKSLGAIQGVSDIAVDETTDTVSFTAAEQLRAVVAEELKSLGYPERGTVSGIDQVYRLAQSYVSCMRGKFKE